MSRPDPKSPEQEPADAAFEVSLRPPLFEEFSGQEKTVARLRLMVDAALQRGDDRLHQRRVQGLPERRTPHA